MVRKYAIWLLLDSFDKMKLFHRWRLEAKDEFGLQERTNKYQYIQTANDATFVFQPVQLTFLATFRFRFLLKACTSCGTSILNSIRFPFPFLRQLGIQRIKKGILISQPHITRCLHHTRRTHIKSFSLISTVPSVLAFCMAS